MYFAIRWLSIIIVRSFFKRVNLINPERIPLYGPVIFVGNHNNQFMDATILIATIPRHVYFLIAHKSLQRGIIGKLARAAGCIPVKRPGDVSYLGIGTAIWDIDSFIITGNNTRFKIDLRPGDKMQLYNESYTIQSIQSDTALTLQGIITVECNDKVNGVKFKVFPKIDQSLVYDAVSDHLKDGNTIGIFPEGGSHDRTTLLPLKPGVALMALTSALQGAEDVMIVPLGLSYESPHRLQGLATAQFGFPIQISKELAKKYQESPKTAIAKILHEVEEGMLSCLITAQDSTTMSYIRLCCSLYQPERLTLSTDKYYTLHQLVSKVFWECANRPELKKLQGELSEYKNELKAYSIYDNEVWMLKQSTAGASISFMETCYFLVIDAALALPICPLWIPLRWTASVLAEKHREKALADSRVKLRGTDVVASYKVLVLLVIVPIVNILYGFLFGVIFLRTWTHTLLCILFCLCILPYLYYVSLQRFEALVGDIRKLKILIYVLVGKVNIWRDTERLLVSKRIRMQLKVRRTIKLLGETVSPTFLDELYQQMPHSVLESDSKRLISKKDAWVPIQLNPLLSNHEEIL